MLKAPAKESAFIEFFPEAHAFDGNSAPITITDLGSLATMPVVLIGTQGAGKTTLARELQALDREINYVSLGEISRALDPNSAARKELDTVYSSGGPTGRAELFLGILEPHIDTALARTGGFILDGMPKKVEEVDPLLSFLREKNADLQLVVSCAVDPLVAFERIRNMRGRMGNPDELSVLLNRTKIYNRQVAELEQQLTSDGKIPLFIVDTEHHEAKPAARTVLYLSGIKPEHTVPDHPTPEHEDDTMTKLFVALRQSNREAAIRLIGPMFDDSLTDVDYGILTSAETADEVKQHYVEIALMKQDPELRRTPHFLRRLARNYLDTTVASIAHLHDSLKEEVALRHGQEYTKSDIEEIVGQQIELKDIIEKLQDRILAGQSLESLTDQEIFANLPELLHIETVLKDRAAVIGTDPSGVSVFELMRTQPALWGQLTSNQIIFIPDVNYRKAANGVPESHHSLFPFTRKPRAMAANSMGEYIPFIEAVSASDQGFGSTFGFIHFVGIDRDGQAFGVEYPILMHDQRLLDLQSPIVNEVLSLTNRFYFNHDIWHNLLPVYARNFILHHPDAPLSYGGRLPAYEKFGTGLRLEKEEYEIGVAMAHARTQRERFDGDPLYLQAQQDLLLAALARLEDLPSELSGKCTADEIADIIDYLACAVATKAYNVFPDGEPIYDDIKEKLIGLGVKPLRITASEITELLFKQGLLRQETVELLLSEAGATEQDKSTAIVHNSALAMQLLRQALDTENPGRESGAEHIVYTLQSWGAINHLTKNPDFELDAIQKSRWLAIIGPQRQQLRGHMEKVHGKHGYMFDGDIVSDPRDLVLMQSEVLATDSSEYAYRQWARSQNQKLSYRIYSLLFDDSQDVQRDARRIFNHLRSSDDTGQRLTAQQAVTALDEVLDQLVTNVYGAQEVVLDFLESFAEALYHSGHEHLSVAIRSVLNDYRKLAKAEIDHQAITGRSYSQASRELVEETMDIS
jgi:adenylate kinase family enzyme